MSPSEPHRRRLAALCRSLSSNLTAPHAVSGGPPAPPRPIHVIDDQAPWLFEEGTLAEASATLDTATDVGLLEVTPHPSVAAVAQPSGPGSAGSTCGRPSPRTRLGPSGPPCSSIRSSPCVASGSTTHNTLPSHAHLARSQSGTSRSARRSTPWKATQVRFSIDFLSILSNIDQHLVGFPCIYVSMFY